MPSADSHPPGPGEAIIRRTSTSYSSKGPWLPLILAVVLVPLLLTALATLTGIGKRDAIERDLGTRSLQALGAAGISGAAVKFDGRDATVSGVPTGQEEQAKQAVLDVEGVRVAAVDNKLTVKETSSFSRR